MWIEGDITKDELLEFYDEHIENFKELISKYDKLTPQNPFKVQYLY